MTLKIVGAWMIAWGIMSLMFGLVGLRLGMLWFLDELGPVVGYCLKGGLIVLGILIWRKDRLTAVQDNERTDEERRSYVPVIVCGTVVLGAVLFMAAGTLKEKRLERQLVRASAPAAWAAKPVGDWPPLVLWQRARFKHHTPMSAGCASLVRLPTGQVAALTAAHLLGRDGGVRPGFARGLSGIDLVKLKTLNQEITSWTLFVPGDEEHPLGVSGLFGEAKELPEFGDELLLRLAPGAAAYPAQPMGLRLEPVPAGESLSVVRCELDDRGEPCQVVHSAKRIAGLVFVCELDKPANLDGASGAPIVDRNGLLVGIVTGGVMDPTSPPGSVRLISGHAVSELLTVLKSAANEKPGPAQPADRTNAVPKLKQKPAESPLKKWKPGKSESMA